ncbi:helix-turn-helix transcriptional regulator [Pantoea sp. Bo_2]|uniref:Helix-turn-helix transcriptional regulator n=1 Tax=Candidatus Pantoea gossypiicola TaxID=2608008 RepID=A0AB34CDG7_9GAMM|nr:MULTISPECIES: S24 family peptidase [Pantoea]KAA5923441.1 helix-turn-helix transcriptional regulator [Pantoea sp. VH_8]KAA5929185.1 helix-turn-helix transcriptional regulator [Pantoea sp. VH_4]KAA5980153.1 helix-turn-helix transcriptional regulator [Pantoea sp. M_4]KAA6039302.1 helix-turn-helix transcriptional regulator [Pantoea sp. FN_2b]KAA6044169.1 helix-turn-helix transcriptional regulator [Pantoea sp. Bo_5]
MSTASAITELLKMKGWSQAELARQMGVSAQSVQYWTSGVTSPRGKRLAELSKISGLPQSWFLGETEGVKLSAPNEEKRKDSVTFQVMDVEFSCGSGTSLRGDFVDVVRSIELDPEYASQLVGNRPFKNVEIGNARGDSMSPTISPGDLLFLDKTVTYFDGDGIYAFCFEGECYVKRLQKIGSKIVVLSDNSNYQPWSIDKEATDLLYIQSKVISSVPFNINRFG